MATTYLSLQSSKKKHKHAHIKIVFATFFCSNSLLHYDMQKLDIHTIHKLVASDAHNAFNEPLVIKKRLAKTLSLELTTVIAYSLLWMKYFI